MKRSYKILLGIASIWPILYTIFFVAFVVWVIFYTGAFGPRPLDVPTDRPLNPELAAPITVVFILHFLTILLVLGMKVYFTIHVLKNKFLESNTKIIWVVVLFLAGMLAEPVYWYLNIWRDPQPSSQPLAQPPNWR